MLNTEVYDEIVQVTDEQAFEAARELARRRASSSASPPAPTPTPPAWSARRPENKGKLVVTVLCDTGERYLSTVLFADVPEVKA